MRKLFLSLAICLVSFTAMAQNKMDVQLSDIKKLEVSGNIVLKLSNDEQCWLNGDVDAEVSKDLSWQIEDVNTLILKLKKPMFQSKDDVKSIVLYLTINDLKELDVTNGATILSDSTLVFESIKMDVDGKSSVRMDMEALATVINCSNKSKVVLKGTSNFVSVKSRYSSTVQIEKLESEYAVADASVSAEIFVNATQVVTPIVSTNGNIFYKKHAKVVIPLSNSTENIVAY